MPLGASRVEGNRPKYESFRYFLWKKLSENGYSFDFIGTNQDNTKYPQVNNINFDRDHEGLSGWTSGDILNEIEGWLKKTGPPDIVLFSSPGGNDALENLPISQTISNINNIIDVLKNSNPNIIILIEKMAPVHSDIMTSDLDSYIKKINKEIIKIEKNHFTKKSKIIVVNMSSGFKDEYLADEVHYNEEGAKYIANQYYKVLSKIVSSKQERK